MDGSKIPRLVRVAARAVFVVFFAASTKAGIATVIIAKDVLFTTVGIVAAISLNSARSECADRRTRSNPIQLQAALFSLVSVANAEESEEEPAGEEGEAPPTPSPTPTPTAYTAGVYFGHILYIDPDKQYVFIKPVDPRLRREYFFLDKKTRYTFSEEGERNEKKFVDIVEGQKVAIRFIGEGSLRLADEIFVVFEEFLQPQVYSRRHVEVPKLTTEEIKAKLEEAKEKSGGHGAAKPAESEDEGEGDDEPPKKPPPKKAEH